MAAGGVIIVKRFTYRGQNEEFANVYHFHGSAPTTDTAWLARITDVTDLEKNCYDSSVHIVRAYGYDDTDHDAVYTHDYTALGTEIAGTLSTSGSARNPGDAAVWVRWRTGRTNSKGKAIYLRKYFHPAWSPAGTPDTVTGSQVSALNALGSGLMSGSLTGGFQIADPAGNVPAGPATASTYVTTRTLKRRGKRPT